MAVSVSLLGSLGQKYLPLTRRCPAIGVPQLWHRGFFLAGGGVSNIVVVVVCGVIVASQSEGEVWRDVEFCPAG